MSLQNDNFNIRNTFDVNAEKKHTNDLGLNIPDGYFAKSKQDILNKTVFDKKKKVVPLYKNIYAWSAVAVIALLFTLTMYTGSFSSQENNLENDILIASLTIDDTEVDALLDDYLNDELLTEEVFLE